SRRRHTRLQGDWSSDVCSSDLMDIMEAIDEFPTSCGKVAWDALPKIQELLHACREADVPVIYSTSDPDFKAAFGNATKRGVDARSEERRVGKECRCRRVTVE